MMRSVRSTNISNGSVDSRTPSPSGRDNVVTHRGSYERRLLRVEEAAQWLGLGRTKAYELVYRGLLPSVTIGRSRRVPFAALQAFVEQLTADSGWS